MSDKPSLLTIRATHLADESSTWADLYVDVRCELLVTGDEALTKVPEVRALVSAAGQMGVAAGDVRVERVEARATPDMRGKADPNIYSVRVRIRKLGLLAVALEAIDTFEEVRLRRLEWGFEDGDDRQAERLAACAKTANVKAEAVAKALGVTLEGVHRFEVERVDIQGTGPATPHAIGSAKSVKKAVMGVSLAPRRTVSTTAIVEYRIAVSG